MATKVVLQGNQAAAVYDDRYRPIYEALGTLTVQRATDVEFDHATGDWQATHLGNGQQIGRGKQRDEVIQQEVAWLEREEII